ncbi:MAG: hypothetical protein IKJ27_00665 [Clostridia bacterium]|nr:hypothetical protein [Clostridia bacterium]
MKLKKLISEGFEAENKTSNRGPRIKNYKEYLFDFETEADISRHMLEKINKEEDFDI